VHAWVGGRGRHRGIRGRRSTALMSSRLARPDLPAVAAAVLASAAVTAYWLLGGTLGLDTVGGEIEEQARERTTPTLAARQARSDG
jgi:hypothetical protein